MVKQRNSLAKPSEGGVSPPGKGATARKKTSARKKVAPRHGRATKALKQQVPAESAATPIVPIVGIVASAGGLEAFKGFLKAMPAENGMAFVLVPHLDPMQKSLMAPLLARHTSMPVNEVVEGTPVEPNHVYVIPPNCYLTVRGGILHLKSPVKRDVHQTALDAFLRSLAEDQQERAICIVLSGTGSVGTLGLKAVKANGGLAIVQDPRTAEYDRMPQNAIATGLVDYVLPVEQMPEVLKRYLKQFIAEGAAISLIEMSAGETLSQVIAFLRAHTKFDFGGYRKAMLLRRIQRRMNVNHVDHIKDYVALLRESPEEITQLTKDLLISVTSFFRDRQMYQILQTEVIPDLLRDGSSERPIRIWVPGCATGEEVYSIAMVLFEGIGVGGKPCQVQIFATDIDADALDIARRGIYHDSLMADVSPERIARFFHRADEHTYQVKKEVRETTLFAQQNILSDAPFSRLDLVSCRNLLIYLEPPIQQQLIALLHFALRDGGYLALGPSESLGAHVDLFHPVSKKWRIFRRVGVLGKNQVDFPLGTGDSGTVYRPPGRPAMTQRAASLAELMRQKLVDDYAPAAVLINRRDEVLYFSGPTQLYLQQPRGVPTQDLLELAASGLRARLRAAVQKAVRDKCRVAISGGHIERERRQIPVRVTAEPVQPSHDSEALILVTFEDERPWLRPETTAPDTNVDEALVSQLEHKLKSSRDELHSTIEELEGSNEELKASSEEVMSMNEELQSANEELETSKEELQSLNEELSTVNSQLRDKVEELEDATNDMANLLASTDIATIFLGTDGTIKRFTPAATRLFNLIPSDVGRPISDLTPRFFDPELAPDIESVLRTLVPHDWEVSSSDDESFLRRVTPYRTGDNRIGGVVITLTEISRVKRTERELLQLTTELEQRVAERTAELLSQRNFASGILDTVDAAIYVIDCAGRILKVNAGFEAISGYSHAEVEGKTLLETVVPSDEAPAFKSYLAAILAAETPQRREAFWVRKDGSQRWMSSSKRILGRNAAGEIETIIGSAIDRTAHRMAEQALHAEREFIDSVLETSAALVVVVDAEGRISRANNAFCVATANDPELLPGRLFWNLLPEEERDPLQAAFVKVREGGLPCRHEGVIQTGEAKRTIEWVIASHTGKSQRIEYFVVTGIDVTERQLAEREARAREAELVELHRRYEAGGLGIVVAHEMSQPLSAIANYAEAILTRLAGGNLQLQSLAQDLDQIKAQAYRAGGVVQQLRRLMGKAAEDAQSEDLNEIVRSVCQLFLYESHPRQIQIVQELSEGLPHVCVERVRIEHVLINLLRNAVDAIVSTGRGGTITAQTAFDAASGTGFARATIRDDGPGIGAEDASRAFERFFTTKPHGVGMGLPISHALVSAHGGRLWIEPSESGGIVHFTVPFAP